MSRAGGDGGHRCIWVNWNRRKVFRARRSCQRELPRLCHESGRERHEDRVAAKRLASSFMCNMRAGIGTIPPSRICVRGSAKVCGSIISSCGMKGPQNTRRSRLFDIPKFGSGRSRAISGFKMPPLVHGTSVGSELCCVLRTIVAGARPSARAVSFISPARGSD